MFRYLLVHHYAECFETLFVAVMAILRFAVWPYVVETYGNVGFVVALAAIFAVGYLLDRVT